MEPYYVLGSVYSMCWQAFVQRNQSKDVYHEEQIDRSKERDTRSRKQNRQTRMYAALCSSSTPECLGVVLSIVLKRFGEIPIIAFGTRMFAICWDIRGQCS